MLINKYGNDEFEVPEVPTETSTNNISNFSTQSSKLVHDKGRVKMRDAKVFKSQTGKLIETFHSQ